MNRLPETSQSLLVRIREAHDHESWSKFIAIYAPVIHAYARRKGLQEADAADITQQVLRSVFEAISGFEYDQTKGKFRGWLFTIARNWIYKAAERQQRTPIATGDTHFQESLSQQADSHDEQEAWNRDHELHLFRYASERVKGEFRPTTWDAFWKTVVEFQKPEAVAEELGCSLGAIYIAKSRVVARIRSELESLDDELR